MGKGSFRITQYTLDLLVGEKDFSAVHLAAYLVLARFTDEEGVYTTAGATALERYLGLNWKRAKMVLEDLLALRQDKPEGKEKALEWRYVWPAADYYAAQKKEDQDPSLPRLTYALQPFQEQEEWVWFSNELVDGYGAFQNPLKVLIKYGDVACRLLLLLYKYNAMDSYGGVNPYYIRQTFTGQQLPSPLPGFDGYHFQYKDTTVRIAEECLGMDDWPKGKNKQETEALKKQAIAPFWQALKGLETCGLVYPVITVFNGAPRKNHPPELLYVLHTKRKSGYTPQGEEGLAPTTARIASDIYKRPVCDAQGRFYGRYAVIVPTGMPAHVCGVYRLRFRVSNPANSLVKDTWRMIAEANNQARGWMNKIEGKQSKLGANPIKNGNH